MSKNNFAVFILTHGRPDNVKTYATLRKQGYTGRIVLVIDDLDKAGDKYKENFGDQVYVFDKKKIAKTFDQGDNFNDMRAIIYARNASFEIAKELGIKYFVQLDDDYSDFRFRFNSNFDFDYRLIKDLDRIFSIILDFYIQSGAHTVAIAQGGDFIGGGEGKFIQIKRKCMNSFFCSTDRPFQFIGRINEDVNTYTRQQSTGILMLTITQVALQQMQTQQNKGGMTDIYLDSGTYVKSFYSVMYHPSSVTIKMMSSKYARLHHSVKWINTAPKIISEEHKK